MENFAGLNWLEVGGRLVSYVKLEEVLCRIVYDPILAKIGLYFQVACEINHKLVLETTNKIISYGALLGLLDGKLFLVKSVDNLEQAVRSLLYASFAVLEGLEQNQPRCLG